MKIKLFSLLFLSLMVCVGIIFAQTTTIKAVITPKSWSPRELTDAKLTIPPSQGLKVVGKGEMVYLQAGEAANTAITGYAWSIDSAPAGSTVILDSLDKKVTTFRPDATGEFKIKLAITTAKGNAETTIIITAAKYVGVGGMDGLPRADLNTGQCQLCHFANFTEWQVTGHAEVFKVNIDDALGHYSERCIVCHTVGYNKDATATNDGFDDIMLELGWVFPAHMQAGNYASLLANQPKLAHRANIQCESCHGPGSEHIGVKAHTDVTLAAGMCNRCHQSGTNHIIGTQHKEAVHSIGIPEEANRADCAACHSGSGFILKFDPSNRWAQANPLGNAPVSCAVCHDPHSVDNEHQVRTAADIVLSDTLSVIKAGGLGKLCMQCHHDRRDAEDYVKIAGNISSRFGPHHSPQADMISGMNAIDFDMPMGRTGHLGAPNSCVTCHMAPTPAAKAPGENEIGGHTWKMVWDKDTPDNPADDVENVGACAPCHGPISSFAAIKASEDYDQDGTIEGMEDEIASLKETLGNLLPPDGPTVVVDKANYDWTGKSDAEAARRKTLVKAAYNYKFIDYDGSNGFHNPMFTINLLRRSIAAITKGEIGTGTITSIQDVPGDQGKQVRITWSKFGADGISDMPVQFYTVWRRVDAPKKAAAGLGKNIPVIPNLESIKGELQVGARVEIADQLWDYVGSVPAAGMASYTTVVPTLYDSSKSVGVQWSVFKIAAHTDMTYWYKVSVPDSGYSIDNLAPVTPANVKVQEVNTGLTVMWDQTTDQDVKQYTLYRSTFAGFDYRTVQPLANVSENSFTDNEVAVGKTYYYRVTATDFGGNESAGSAEAALLVTSVADGSLNGMPKEFTLAQNYPNPFNPTTSIIFGLPRASQVRVNVYNLQGALVRTLATGAFSAGYQTMTWDGRDDNGLFVSAGAYIYRLEAENLNITKKMIYLK
jgi:hypothetical protein